MRIIKIPTNFKKYDGGGYAMAAVDGDGNIADLIYLRDILPEIDEDEPGFDLGTIINDQRVGAKYENLAATGAVSIGMVSCFEFIEI